MPFVDSGPTIRLRAWAMLAASLAVAFGMWYWARVLLVPVSTSRAVAGGRPIGNNSDLYPRWLGARELLLYGRDPYSPEVTREIQDGFYGRPLDPNLASDPRDQQAFAYPVYVSFLLAPSVRLTFSAVMTVFGWLLLACTAASIPLWVRALGVRLPAAGIAAVAVLTLSTYPVVQGFYKQQLTLLVAFFLAAAVAGVTRGWLTLSGILLALATIKPQISGLLIVWLLLWAIGGWKERRRLVFSFGGMMGLLLLGSELVLRGWTSRFLHALREYQNYAADLPILEILLSSMAGKMAAAALLVAALAVCWSWRHAPAGSHLFAWAVALMLTVTLVVIPKVAPYNQVLLIPAFLLLARPLETRRRWRLLSGAMTKASYLCQGWQWMAAAGLVAISFVIPLEVIRPLVQLPLYTIFALPVVTLFAVVLRTPWRASVSQVAQNQVAAR